MQDDKIVCVSASLRHCLSLSDFTLSTSAVFFPWFSWVTLRTAKSFAFADFKSNCWRLWTFFTSPFFEARSLLQLETRPLQLAPFDRFPFIPLRFRMAHDLCIATQNFISCKSSPLLHISHITTSLGFLDYPSATRLAVVSYSIPREHLQQLFRSVCRFCDKLRLLLYAEDSGVLCRSPPLPTIFNVPICFCQFFWSIRLNNTSNIDFSCSHIYLCSKEFATELGITSFYSLLPPDILATQSKVEHALPQHQRKWNLTTTGIQPRIARILSRFA